MLKKDNLYHILFCVMKDGQTDGSVTIYLRNFVGEGIIIKSFA
jgi:hypothetical protein